MEAGSCRRKHVRVLAAGELDGLGCAGEQQLVATETVFVLDHNGLAANHVGEPCNNSEVVTPRPARDRLPCRCSQKASRIIMCGVIGLVGSFTSSSSAICECESMRPGITNFPLASITVAPAGAFTLWPQRQSFRCGYRYCRFDLAVRHCENRPAFDDHVVVDGRRFRSCFLLGVAFSVTALALDSVREWLAPDWRDFAMTAMAAACSRAAAQGQNCLAPNTMTAASRGTDEGDAACFELRGKE